MTVIAPSALAVLFLWKGSEGLWDSATVEISFLRQRVFGEGASAIAKLNIALLLSTGTLLAFGVRYHRLRLYALGLATLLFAGYAVFAQLVLLDVLGNNCACIGWFTGMSWMQIFIINGILLFVTLLLFFIGLKERREFLRTVD